MPFLADDVRQKRYRCTSRDDKPLDLPIGSEVREWDTGVLFVYDGKKWVQYRTREELLLNKVADLLEEILAELQKPEEEEK